ncbi:MAG: DNA topoisomerase 3 [Proteobacteria bacterium]|nr:DNA topoisomerase 3 [Pseudomonadota bacterium]
MARDIARELGASRREAGCFRGPGVAVTWALGHLVALPEPHEIQAAWKKWRLESLPLLPDRWPLQVRKPVREQFERVVGILNEPGVSEVVCATDAGREGELIFRWLMEAAACTRPVKRLWLSTLTPESIRRGLGQLRDAREFDALADAARARAHADWLVGMNLSRAYTLTHDELFSVGRVQTPTLAFLVERERAIRDFEPEDYREVVVRFRPDSGEDETPRDYEGTYFDPERAGREASRLPADGEAADQIVQRALAGSAQLESLSEKTRRVPPPLLHDLTALQRDANRLYGLSARRTLELAQKLYEEHKLLSYPRTDSRVLSSEAAAQLPDVVRSLAPAYGRWFAAGTGEARLSSRFVNDAEVSDHHALVPTPRAPEQARLSADERRIYDLVARRLLAAWHADQQVALTTAVTAVAHPDGRDRYRSRGRRVLAPGWTVLEPESDRTRSANREVMLPPSLHQGQRQHVDEARAENRQTRPPPRYTDATLLAAMERPDRQTDDAELSRALRERGLGTPATRAAILETLLQRGYVKRLGPALAATPSGERLVDAVHPDVRSPALTGTWEARLAGIARGSEALGPFLRDVETHVRNWVLRARTASKRTGESGSKTATAPARKPARTDTAVPAAPPTPARAEANPSSRRPEPLPLASPPQAPARPVLRAGASLAEILRDVFQFADFRPHQEAACRAAADGRDVLLVMPTGAGKSLCYQLPGLARGGTTLVVSPLIALMEDQVAKLVACGLQAARIHSGRPRPEARDTLERYVRGELDYLFVAPERLGVPGFPERLARHRPALIAVDEAHCISQWGHDFRPDYRMLRERLPREADIPLVALTATATPRVQQDIVDQLGLRDAARLIHGFRRHNIAIEHVELRPGARNSAVRALLSDPARRPAIVYAPTRKQAEALARELASDHPASVYHAGLAAKRRDAIQTAFQSGELEVVVATIAFGMGIDKADVRSVVHTALPASVEGYYQEIGRAGRDGAPARATLFFGYSDRRTHDWFLERDYPDPGLLESVFRALGDVPVPAATLRRRLGMDLTALENALDKLWIHGGAQLDDDDQVRRGDETWRAPYAAQRDHRRQQLDDMLRFAGAPHCRMRQLVRHFGDQSDEGADCGLCDVCAPDACQTLRLRPPSEREAEALERLLAAVRERRGVASGRLHREVFGDDLDRRTFDALVAAAARSGQIHVEERVFERDERRVPYRWLTWTSRPPGPRPVCLADAPDPGPKRTARRTKTTRSPRQARSRGAGPRDLRESAGDAPPGLVHALQEWRRVEAKQRRIPAFRILKNTVLLELAAAKPRTADELMAVKGMGPKLVEKYGERLLAILRDSTP